MSSNSNNKAIEMRREKRRAKRKEKIFSENFLLFLLIFFIIGITIFFTTNSPKTKCSEIEELIKKDPFFQENNIACKCFLPEDYPRKIEIDEKIRNRTTLEAVVECYIAGQKKIFPVWRETNNTNNLTR
jgi:hypothetical protein